MVLWAARHERTDAPPSLVARMRQDRTGFLDELRRAVETASAPPPPTLTRDAEGRQTRIGW